MIINGYWFGVVVWGSVTIATAGLALAQFDWMLAGLSVLAGSATAINAVGLYGWVRRTL